MACRLLLLFLPPEEDRGGDRERKRERERYARAVPSHKMPEGGRRGGERGRRGKKVAISQPTTERDCTAGRGISKESYSAGCQAVCSASAY